MTQTTDLRAQIEDLKDKTAVVWPLLIRQCVVDLAKIIEANKPPVAFDLMAARLQQLVDDHRDGL